MLLVGSNVVTAAVQANAHHVSLHGLVVRSQVFLRLRRLASVPLNVGNDLVVLHAGTWNYGI